MAIITTTRVFTRPNKDIVWIWDAYPEKVKPFLLYQKEQCIDTGKILKRTPTHALLEDRTVIEWASESAMNEWFTDPAVVEFHEFRDAYNTQHGITNELIVG
jgi:IS1 family transposase